jgi:hypothetical protein
MSLVILNGGAEKAGANSDAAKLHHSFRSCGGSVFGIPKRSSGNGTDGETAAQHAGRFLGVSA